MTWNGRRMSSFSDGTTKTSYKYNEDGVRTSKTVGDTKTEFFVDGTTILAQKTGNVVNSFYYDANGKRIGFKHNGYLYYYVYNLQGDVTHILNSAGGVVGTYEYDAWGNITNLSSLTSIARQNPFRYRGYYYDTESGLYYLNSRYYNSEWGRFLNADSYVTTGQGLTSYNMFVYCGNNPIICYDPSGNFSMSALMDTLQEIYNVTSITTNVIGNTVDITDKLNNEMKQNAEILTDYREEHNYIQSAFFFIEQVKPGGYWDFKSQSNWNLESNKNYHYNGKILRYDDIGNIHYGYVGRVLFSTDMLLKAGGLVQIYTRTSELSYWSSNFDDPRDQWAIELGCILWDSR